MILSLEWVDTSGRKYTSAFEIARLDNLRKQFLALINCPDYKLSDIKAFILKCGYFQIQVKFDQTLYGCTKPDGLCSFRSLKQQRDASTVNFGTRCDNKYEWNHLDVKLEKEDSRNEFTIFLKSLIEALSSISKDNFLQHDIFDLERCIKKLEFALDKILRFNDDWTKFHLEPKYWCGFILLKFIPHAYSYKLIAFKGAYFISNNNKAMLRYRKGEKWNDYATLVCAMQCPLLNVSDEDAASLRIATIEKILVGNKFVFDSDHFYPIITKKSRNSLEDYVDALTKKIIEFINRSDVPTMPNIIEEVESGEYIESSFKPSARKKEVTVSPELPVSPELKVWYKTELRLKDDQIKNAADEIKRLKKDNQLLRQKLNLH